MRASLRFAGLVALATIAAACGQTPSRTPIAAHSATPAFTHGGIPSAPNSPSVSNAATGPRELIAVARLVYPPSGRSTCDQGVAGAPAFSDLITCPFTTALTARVVTAQQAQAKAVRGDSVLCHCESAPTSYNTTKAAGSASGGTAIVVAEYCCGNTLTFTLTIVTDHGRLSVDDIIVQGKECGRPEEIDATRC